MKRSLIIAAAALTLAAAVLPIARLAAQETVTVPKLQYRAIYDFFKKSRPIRTSAKSSASP